MMRLSRFRQFFQLLSSTLWVLKRNAIILGFFALIALFFLHRYHIVLKLHQDTLSLQLWYNWVYVVFYGMGLTYSMMILHAADILYLWDRLKQKKRASFFCSIGQAILKIKLMSQWIAFHFVFGFAFNLTEWWIPSIAARNEKKYGVRWILARNVILPFILIENLSPFRAWKRIGTITRGKTFTLTKNIINWLGLLYFFCLPIAIVVFYLLFSHTTHLKCWIIGLAIYLAVLVIFIKCLIENDQNS